MAGEFKNIAIIGANKEGLRLLPLLLGEPRLRVRLIADPNREAMLFKLEEMGYRVAPKYGIKTSSDINEVKRVADLDIIINALQDQATERFLEGPEFKDVEKLGPLSARLIWGLRGGAPGQARPEGYDGSEQTVLLASLREIVDAVRLAIDRRELLSVILRLATESARADRGSIMLLSRDEGALRVEIAKGMDEEVVRKIRVPLGVGISGRAARDARAMLVSGKASAEEFLKPMDRSDVKSAMCVPLVVDGSVIGVINVSTSESAHSFTNDDLNFLTTLAALAAEVIQRSSEYERLSVDSAKFAFWKEADSIMNSPLPLDKRLLSVAKRLVEIIPGLTCSVYVNDDETGRLMLAATSLRDTRGVGVAALRPGEGIEGSAMESGRDVVLVDRAQEGSLKRVYAALPMSSHGIDVGVFSVQISSPGGLSAPHESFIREMRTLLADSIYKHKQAEREKARSRKMFAVDESGLELIAVGDRKRLMNLLVTVPSAIMGAEGAMLRLRQGAGQRFATAAYHGLDEARVREQFLPVEKETVAEVLRKKAPVQREFSEEVSPYIRSVMSFPLTVEGRIAGVLTFFNRASEGAAFPCAFTAADLDIMMRFAVYAEKALINLRQKGPEEAAGAPPEGREWQPPLKLFERRVEEELNRARRRDKFMMLATMRVAGFKDQGFSGKAEIEKLLMGAIRARIRNFDVAVKLNEETFGFLFPDAGAQPPRVFDSLQELMSVDASLAAAVDDGRLEVMCGFALFPRDGDSFAELFSKASRRTRLDVSKPYETGF